MNVLMVGSGKGSWEMRGLQISAALGARVTSTSHPQEADWRWASICVLVKHAGAHFCREAQRFHVPIVWDVLDIWRQPSENHWMVEDGKRHVASLARTIRPAAMIAATQAMATDIGGFYIPHQCRMGLHPTPPRDEVRVVGYDGSERYLGRWAGWIHDACREHGWEFRINPANLMDCDILVAFRDGQWDGPLCRQWKSGVKYVNAICAGRPILTQQQNCAAAIEIGPHGKSVSDRESLACQLEWLSGVDQRRSAAEDERYQVYSVDAIARTYYQPLLQSVAEAKCVA